MVYNNYICLLCQTVSQTPPHRGEKAKLNGVVTHWKHYGRETKRKLRARTH